MKYTPDLEKIRAGKTDKERNFLERLEFVKFWADYIKTIKDSEWSRQQNLLIDSQIISSRRVYKKLADTPEGKEKIKRLRNIYK